MIRPETLAAIRFGYGLSPHHAPPDGPGALIAGLSGPDRAAAAYPMISYATVRETLNALNAEKRALRKAGERDSDRAKALRQARNGIYNDNLRTQIARVLDGSDTLRDRLTAFWADHFTTVAKSAKNRASITPFVDEVIRPHVTGRFADMLRAVVTHPVMLGYLDQPSSFGPMSKLGQDKGRGLNENLAREVLELHTLGVGAGYTQQDVREFAELLTGLRSDAARGFFFDGRAVEPGGETVLGRVYDGDDLSAIHAALDDLAVHPATARHIARKLAVHFVADAPDPGLVEHVAARYRATGGDLAAVMTALIEHPAAWTPALQKAKRPQEFILSGLRALGVRPKRALKVQNRHLRSVVLGPLQAMGQPYQRAKGPDGWDEAFDAWITPQGLAARIQWAMAAPQALRLDLPDPRDFVDLALADAAGAETRFAAKAAETRWEGIGLILSSPEFNRR